MNTPGRYITVDHEGSHVVLFVREDSEWWQVIARFASSDRADSYAEIENMAVTEDWPAAGDDYGGDILADPPKLPAPDSIIDRIVDEVRHADEPRALPAPESEDIDAPEPVESEEAPAPALASAAETRPCEPAPPPETDEEPDEPETLTRADQLWIWIEAQHEKQITVPSRGDLAEAAGMPRSSLEHAMKGVRERGLADFVNLADGLRIDVLAGQPKETGGNGVELKGEDARTPRVCNWIECRLPQQPGHEFCAEHLREMRAT